MSSDTVTITGLAETKTALQQFGQKMEKSILRRGLRVGAKPLLEAARSEAPELSGATRRNVKIRSGRGKPGTIALSVGVGAKDFRGTTFYVGFVLYGHKVGPRKLGDKRKSVPPNNFLQRAYAAAATAAVAATTQSWSDQVKQIGTQTAGGGGG